MVILIHQMYYFIQIKEIHVMQRTVHILNYILLWIQQIEIMTDS